MPMKRILTFTLLLFFGQTLFAQNDAASIGGARSLGMGATGVVFQDIHSLFTNQAGLANLEDLEVTAFGRQRFLLSSLNNFSLGVAYPTNSGTIGLSLDYFGFSTFNEQKIGIAYGRKLFDKLQIGAKFDFLNTRIEEFGSRSNFTFELGFISELLPELTLGAHIYNPLRLEITEDEILPSILTIGAGYKPSEKVLLILELQKDVDFPATFKGGVEYYVIDIFSIRAGVGNQPSAFSFGFGLKLKSGIAIDLASSYHTILGFTPSVGLVYRRGE